MDALNQVGQRVSLKLLLLLAAAGGVGLWAVGQGASGMVRAESAAAAVQPASEFANAVAFEQGATRFRDGDRIEISEVRGTSPTFGAGNLYVIKGTYTLASADRATLAAYVTATTPEHARSPSLAVQHLVIERGTGKFTLFLPMYSNGLPHVSFYPADGGEGFGGNYFGTGDLVMKKWWDER